MFSFNLEKDAWCASDTNTQQFIQVDFLKKTRVTKVETFGRKEKFFWVKKYILQYSTDDITWLNYTENGFVKVGCIFDFQRNIKLTE